MFWAIWDVQDQKWYRHPGETWVRAYTDTESLSVFLAALTPARYTFRQINFVELP